MLGVDYGERRIGIALSEGRVAVPLAIIEHRDRNSDLERVADSARAHDVDRVVVGLPLLMSGEEGEQVRRTRRFGDALARRIDVPVVYHDERLSSYSAERAARDVPSKGAPRHVDDVAASMILQSYIDRVFASVTTEDDAR